jgi:hypothetical protein
MSDVDFLLDLNTEDILRILILYNHVLYLAFILRNKTAAVV